MSKIMRVGAKYLAFGVVAFAIASCGLPRTGPNKKEIFAGSIQREGNAFIISVNDRVIAATKANPNIGFSTAFRNAGRVGADTLRPGDTLALTIYENVDEGLLGVAGVPSNITELQVDQSGFIFVPFAGRIRAAGNTPEALRGVITRKLDTQTPDPQVIVRRLPGDGSSVTLIGAAAQGVFPIEASTSTLIGMIAKAGGVKTKPQETRIKIVRNGMQESVWLSDLYDRPQDDVALRPGDKIIVEEDKRRYTSLGATGGQALMEFPKPTLTAIEAIAQIGGLNSNLADPTGVFVFRDETAEFANKVLARDDFQTNKRFAYVLDLTEPTGMFLARDFEVRDGDTIYVTEAPYVQWTKTLQVITGTVGGISSLAGTANALSGN